MKKTINQRPKGYTWNVERRNFPANLWTFHMDSLADLVVCTNRIFLLPKLEEKNLKNLCVFSK